MHSIERENARRIMEAATRHALHRQQAAKIQSVWKSDWLWTAGDKRRARAVVGKSNLGYHGGLQVQEMGKSPWFQWGAALPRQEQAVSAAQGAGSAWLGSRDMNCDPQTVQKQQDERMEAMERRFSKSLSRGF